MFSNLLAKIGGKFKKLLTHREIVESRFYLISFQEIVDEIDEDGSGELEFPEFIQLAAKFLVEEDEEQMKWELKEAFRIYDKQGNGYITTPVLKEILREIDSTLSEDNLDQIVDEVDEDGSGTVDFDEFMSMMTGE